MLIDLFTTLKIQEASLNTELKTFKLNIWLAIIVKEIQRKNFPEEIINLNLRKDLKSSIKLLCPFLAKQPDIKYEQIHPTILPKNYKIRDLIVEREHKRLLRAVENQVLI